MVYQIELMHTANAWLQVICVGYHLVELLEWWESVASCTFRHGASNKEVCDWYSQKSYIKIIQKMVYSNSEPVYA